MNKFTPNIMPAIAMLLALGFGSAYGGETQNRPGGNPAPNSAASAAQETLAIDLRNKPLCDVMREIHIRSGAEVKLPQNLAGDVISRSAQGSTWQIVVEHLLEDYNYRAIWGKGGQPIQLTVYGRHQDAEGLASAPAPVGEDLLVYGTSSALPQKFQGLNPSSVNPVSLPAERMKGMQFGEKLSLTLPCGQFSVVYDNRLELENGDFIWEGYLEDSGKSYRVIIAMGSNGNMGQVLTPDAVYNLDSAEGRTWLVDTGYAS